jgi:hypothetical protein
MNQRWKIISAFLAVFLAGVVCAASANSWFRGHNGGRLSFAEKTMERFEGLLVLTPGQTERIRSIVIQSQKDWRQMRRDGLQKISGVFDRMHDEVAAELLPEQRVKLEAIREEFRIRAERLHSPVDK